MSVPLPPFALRELVEHGVHYGHRVSCWNPLMAEFIYGVENGGYVIDLRKTMVALNLALRAVADVASKGKKLLFLGTRPLVSDVVRQQAERCGQYYVVSRWLGGTITNLETVSKSVAKMVELEDLLVKSGQVFTKHELLRVRRQVAKLSANLCGIRHMKELPDMLVVFDVGKDAVAIKEANIRGIPVVGVVDTNNSPKGVTHVIPANDDSSNSIYLLSRLLADAVISGVALRKERQESIPPPKSNVMGGERAGEDCDADPVGDGG